MEKWLNTNSYRELWYKINNQISWYESLPNDGGRYTVLDHDGTTKQNSIIVNDTMTIRTRVHEYGGGSYCTLPPEVTGSLAVDFKTQQLFHININCIERIKLSFRLIVRGNCQLFKLTNIFSNSHSKFSIYI